MATLRTIDGAYVVDYRENGKRRRQTLGRVGTISEREAQKVVAQMSKVATRAYRILYAAPAPIFEAFTTDYLKWHACEHPASHPRVAQIVADHLIPAFGAYELTAITPRDVETWKHQRLAPREGAPRPQTVIKELRTLKAILNKAVQWGEIERNPIEHVAAPKDLDSKPPRFLTTQELDRLYAACHATANNGAGPQSNPLHEHWWRLYANTGLRRAEGVMLRWDWISHETMRVLSTDGARTKSGKWREVPLTAGAIYALTALPVESEYVLPRIALPSLSRAFNRDAQRAGLVDCSLHTLRHTYISHLVMNGVPLRAVQKLAGHSTINVTEPYAHLAPDYLKGLGGAINL